MHPPITLSASLRKTRYAPVSNKNGTILCSMMPYIKTICIFKFIFILALVNHSTTTPINPVACSEGYSWPLRRFIIEQPSKIITVRAPISTFCIDQAVLQKKIITVSWSYHFYAFFLRFLRNFVPHCANNKIGFTF